MQKLSHTLKCTFNQSFMVQYSCGLEIEKTIINNKVRTIEQIFLLDPVK